MSGYRLGDVSMMTLDDPTRLLLDQSGHGGAMAPMAGIVRLQQPAAAALPSASRPLRSASGDVIDGSTDRDGGDAAV
jgi:hypothetical protein